VSAKFKIGPGCQTVLSLLLLLAADAPGKSETLRWPADGVALGRQRSDTRGCARNLVQVLRAALFWSLDNADQPPPSLEILTNELVAPGALFCPAFFHDPVPESWAQVDWAQIDYLWDAGADWHDPASIVCRCRAHQTVGRADGSVSVGTYQPGWPRLTASPMGVDATPGEGVILEWRLAPDAEIPVTTQWRRVHLASVTNITWFYDPENPTVVRWATNITSVFRGTNLIGKTNAFLSLPAVQPDDSGFYCVAISNRAGVSWSLPARLRVDPGFARLSTNADWSAAYCSNNLEQIWLCAKFLAEERGGLLPQSLAEMTDASGTPVFGWPRVLFCRSDTNRFAPAEWAGVDLTDTSYEIIPGDRLNPFDVFCRCRQHGFYVAVDGGVMLGPTFREIAAIPNGPAQLRFRAFAGSVNILEASIDLTDWKPLAYYGLEGGDFLFTDHEGLLLRFYRLRKED
jgi:hypothetical protein